MAFLSKCLEEILKERPQISRGFIFGQGRGPIYVNDPYGGLLGGTDFYDDIMTFENEETRRVFVAERKEGKVFKVLQPYFDQVWNAYKFSIKGMLSDFRHDFLEVLLPFMNPFGPEVFPKALVRDKIFEDERMPLRIKSFIQEEISLVEDDEEEEDEISPEELYYVKLQGFESKENKSYHFVNLNKSLRSSDMEEQFILDSSYKKLCIALRSFMYPNQEDNISQEELRGIRDTFSTLYGLIK